MAKKTTKPRTKKTTAPKKDEPEVESPATDTTGDPKPAAEPGVADGNDGGGPTDDES